MENHFIFQQSQWKIEKNHDLNFRAKNFVVKKLALKISILARKFKFENKLQKKSLSLNFRVEIMFS